jgi:hypothetical protein
MERNWTETGAELVEKLGGREVVEREIDEMEWQTIPEDGALTVGFLPGAAVNEVIRELRIPKVTAVAITGFDRPATSEQEDGFYPGFYGIEGNYSNGRARVFVLDVGTYIQPLVSYFWPKATEEVAA